MSHFHIIINGAALYLYFSSRFSLSISGLFVLATTLVPCHGHWRMRAKGIMHERVLYPLPPTNAVHWKIPQCFEMCKKLLTSYIIISRFSQFPVVFLRAVCRLHLSNDSRMKQRRKNGSLCPFVRLLLFVRVRHAPPTLSHTHCGKGTVTVARFFSHPHFVAIDKGADRHMKPVSTHREKMREECKIPAHSPTKIVIRTFLLFFICCDKIAWIKKK